MNGDAFWKMVSAAELIAAFAVIALDLLIPTLVILAICVVSLLIRHQGPRDLGFRRAERPARMVLVVLVLVLAWIALQFAFTMPVLNRLTGATQDLSAFEDLKGTVGQLLFLLIATWTLAAFGEEIVYRGFLQARVLDVVGSAKIGIVAAVLVTSALFGLAHAEQGAIGIAVTFLDAVFFSAVKLKFDNLWASVLAHGLGNTAGILAFFFVGPLYGLW